MQLVESDYAAITVYVHCQLARRQLTLKDKSKKILIDGAIKTYRESDGNWSWMIQLLESELDLLASMARPFDYVIDICEIFPSHAVHASIKEWLSLQGLTLHHDVTGYFIRCSRQYDIATLKRGIWSLLAGRDIEPLREPRTDYREAIPEKPDEALISQSNTWDQKTLSFKPGKPRQVGKPYTKGK